MALEELTREGWSALATCDWAKAAALFRQALEGGETGEALDGLGQVSYWQGDYTRALALRERAYGLYRRTGEYRQAALVAARTAMLHGLVHDRGVAASRWVGHAQSALKHCGDCPERGWVELLAASFAEDPEIRERRAELALEIGRRHGESGLQFTALAYLGRALVEKSEIAGGMHLVDQAVTAVTSGAVEDLWAAGEIYCTLFQVCEMTMDVKRAEGSLAALDRYVMRTGQLAILGVCRMHYGGLLVAAGRWAEAERELLTALRIYEGSYRASSFAPLLRLADLRVRQGRLAEAQELLAIHGSPAEAVLALARLQQARARLLTTSNPALALTDARAALAWFERLGASPDSAAAVALLGQLGDWPGAVPAGSGESSDDPRKRETGLLGVLEEGRANAARLLIIPRGVGHQVSVILSKLGVRTRAGAVISLLRQRVSPSRARSPKAPVRGPT